MSDSVMHGQSAVMVPAVYLPDSLCIFLLPLIMSAPDVDDS